MIGINVIILILYTASGLSYDAMFNFTNIELSLITDNTMHDMTEDGVHGGISSLLNDIYLVVFQILRWS